MKTKEEPAALKEKNETAGKKSSELADDELEQVTGGLGPGSEDSPEGSDSCPYHFTEIDRFWCVPGCCAYISDLGYRHYCSLTDTDYPTDPHM